MKKLLLLFVVLATAITASAYDFQVNGLCYNITSEDDLTCEFTYKEINYNSYSGNIVIPSTVTYNEKTFSVTSIGKEAFYYCSKLTSVTIPNSVISIEQSAFKWCTGLASVVIPNSVIAIGKEAFSCSNLTSVVFGNSVTSIGEQAFRDCCCLTSVEISNSVIEIGDWAFYGCNKLKSVVIGNSVTSIGSRAFSGCSSMTSVVIGTSVTSINQYAFSGCYSLTSVVIPSSVTSIGYAAFEYCRSMTSLVIPGSIFGMGTATFRGCTSLKQIVSLAVAPLAISSNTFEDVSKTDAVVKVPAESVESYKAAENWKEFSNIIALTEKEMNTLAISTPFANGDSNKSKAYSLDGAKVDSGAKGVVIVNGKKVLLK